MNRKLGRVGFPQRLPCLPLPVARRILNYQAPDRQPVENRQVPLAASRDISERSKTVSFVSVVAEVVRRTVVVEPSKNQPASISEHHFPLFQFLPPTLRHNVSVRPSFVDRRLIWCRYVRQFKLFSGPDELMRTPTMLAALLLTACTGAAQAAPYIMLRDPGCPCCEQWAEHLRNKLRYEVTSRDEPKIAAIKAAKGVPGNLASCHTIEIEGYVIEGHVPAGEIKRLLSEKPTGVKGLAVAGMPLGSPGMEADGQVQPYHVIAFGDFGQRVFASYP